MTASSAALVAAPGGRGPIRGAREAEDTGGRTTAAAPAGAAGAAQPAPNGRLPAERVHRAGCSYRPRRSLYSLPSSDAIV